MSKWFDAAPRQEHVEQRDLFDVLKSQQKAPDGWRPDAPPELRGEKHIRLDAETSGLQWWEKDRPVGWAYLLPESGRRGYLPFAHRGGGNLDEAAVLEWMRRELRGVHVYNVNTKFDLHMAREWGADLTAQGCTFGDVAHNAALLDDHRFRFNLDQLAKDFLGEDEGKYQLGLKDKGQIAEMPAWVIAPYAVVDVELVDRLVTAMEPDIDKQDLRRVLAVEQEIIKVVVEMEKNGVHLDLDTLFRWQQEAHAEYDQILFDIQRETGVRMSSPDSNKDLAKVFKARGIPITAFTARGNPSFTEDVLKAAASKDPLIAKLFYASQLADLLSKYLDKYAATVRRSDGWIRFNLHQLRVGKDENEKFGTVSGRFSSAGDSFGGFNIQQVVSADKQSSRNWCPKYVIRNLFLPGTPQRRAENPNLKWLAVDAAQIEYRIFAHFANAPDIIEKYNADPNTDYHNIVQEVLRTIKPNIGRKQTKITNFGKLFGSGIIKFAHTLETITTAQFEELTDKYNRLRGKRERYQLMREEPLLQEALSVYDAYDEKFPSAKETLEDAKRAAKERGFVRTLLGRRARFPRAQRLHSALNRAIQGTAADLNKLMLVDIYNRREEFGLTMRATVHDELDADIEDDGVLEQLEDTFNEQRLPLRVPILWEVGVGPSWGQAKGKA